jgi:ferrous iron transport protein B
MPVTSQEQAISVALIGNPNTGKSTLFNALVGVRQRTGNYPGVTVEKKVGRIDFHDQSFSMVDLPGTYSLAPRSPDEMIAVDVLLGRRNEVAQPDVVLYIVDASNLERNLYLISQVLELARPTVLALNMVDVAKDKGLAIDVDRLRKQLGIPIVEVQANRKRGLTELKEAIAKSVGTTVGAPASPFADEFQREVDNLVALTNQEGDEPLPRYLAERLLLDTSGYLQKVDLPGVDDKFLEVVSEARERLAEIGQPIPAVEAMSRYAWVSEVLEGVVKRPVHQRNTVSDRIDRILTHRLWGSLVFVALMIVMFQSVFLVAEPASWAIDQLNGWLAGLVDANLSEGPLRSLLVDGVIAGVGGVLVFLPQIFTLFFFIAVLEGCGYMARAAYLMDRLMSRVGLSGKSFIPLLSSFACAIPGIMAARVIENRRDRLTTILVAPLMSCSARLPVYVLLIGAFIPNTKVFGGFLGLQGLTMFAMYSIGIVAAVFVALILKKTILRGPTPAFVMELPSYKVPSVGAVLHRMFDRGWAFVRRAGTLIVAVTIIVWAAAYYPRDESDIAPDLLKDRDRLESEIAELESEIEQSRDGESRHQAELKSLREQSLAVDNEIEGSYLKNSFLGRMGEFVEPVVKPLGWDWKIGCAAIASFPAREVVVATMGVIYNLGSDVDEDSQELQASLKRAEWEVTEEPVFNIPVALSIMVFFALCAQCASTLVVMKRETNSWRWPLFTFVYMTSLAYIGALLTYRIGMLFIA